MPTSPQIITITKAGKTLVQKRGAPVCFYISNYKLDKNPKVVDSLFRISSHLEQKNKTTLNLKKSVPVDYKVEIYAIKAAEYVMIEIPIPSSCYYSNKSAGKLPFEVNREYFDDKVVVFCRNLPQGHHKLNVELQPLFEGRSTVLPVKVSLMYYPDHYGINSKSEVWVKE